MKRPSRSILLIAAGCSGPETFPAGQWQIRSEVKEADIGGREVGFATGRAREWSSCIAASEARNPAGRLIPGVLSGSCTFDQASFASGRISARGECISGALARMQVSLDGSFSGSTLRARLVTVEPNAGLVVDQPGEQDVTTRIDVAAERRGDC